MFYTLACGLLAFVGPAKALLRADAEAQVASARDQPHSSFSQWTQLHGKVYETEEEYARRYAIWLDNLNYIESYNSGQTTHWLGLSPHADLTSEEFQSQWLGFDYEKAKNQPRKEVSLGAENGELPDSVDWVAKGAVTKVKNQKSCGSCWAFSTTGAIEGVNEIYTGDLVSLSEQELVDCDVAVDHGCNGGLMDHAFDWVIENGGIDTEKDYKYNAKQGQCNVARENRHVVTIDSYRDVPSGKPAELQAAVAKQPVAIAVQANQRSFQLYGGGVLSEGCGEDLDHGVLLVGYGTDKPGTENATDFWTVKNSWGPFWGEDGYIRIARNMTDGPGQCGITLLASYPVKTHANPPKPPPPAPPPPPGPAPPPGPGPAPYVKCDNIVSCPPKTTCCCQVSMYDQCFAWACCPLVHATCCDDRVHCCPETAPVCDVEGGRCLPKGRSGLLGALTAGVPMVEKIPAIPNDPAGDERVSTIRQV